MTVAVARVMRIIAAATAVHVAPVAAEAQQIEATVTVSTSKAGPVIERDVYGQFAEHLGRSIYEGVWVGENSSIPNTRGYRNDVLGALRRIKVPVIRWPGGCFADEYHWRDTGGRAGAIAGSGWRYPALCNACRGACRRLGADSVS